MEKFVFKNDSFSSSYGNIFLLKLKGDCRVHKIL